TIIDHGSSSDGVLLIVFFQAEDGIRDRNVTGVQTCALPIFRPGAGSGGTGGSSSGRGPGASPTGTRTAAMPLPLSGRGRGIRHQIGRAAGRGRGPRSAGPVSATHKTGSERD